METLMQSPVDRSVKGVIKAWFDYNPDTGEIFWRKDVSPDWYKHHHRYEWYLKNRAGKLVEFQEAAGGYYRTGAGGQTAILAHHIVWVLTYDEMPRFHIDHIDGNPKNNHISNLRDVPQRINMRNQKLRCTNRSGVTGVHWVKSTGRWRARITLDGKGKHLGYYDTVEEAAEARREFLIANQHLGFTERHG